MKAYSFRIGCLFLSAVVLPLAGQSPHSKAPVAPANAHAARLLREAAGLVNQFPAIQRSTALNSLSDAWRNISPQQSRKLLEDSFYAASSTVQANSLDEQGEQQAAVIRRMAAQDLSAARALIGQMRPPNQGEYTTQHDWRADAWDQLLQQSLSTYGLVTTLEQVRFMTEGLADTEALTYLVGQTSRQDPPATRDLITQALQQFAQHPLTSQRYYTFPKALILLAEIDRPMARRIFAMLPTYLPEAPDSSEAATSEGKQRLAFRHEAMHMLIRKAERFDPELAQEWLTKWNANHALDEANPEDDAAAEPEHSGQTQESEADAQARRTLRQAERLSHRRPGQAKQLLDAGRNQASGATDPAARAALYAGLARTEDRLNDPRAEIDLETALSAISSAERTAKDEQAQHHLLDAELSIMPLILQKLDPVQAEIRARQFSSPLVRFRALIFLAERSNPQTRATNART